MYKILAGLFAVSLAGWAAAPNMPSYRWENFTTANSGLPDDHIF